MRTAETAAQAYTWLTVTEAADQLRRSRSHVLRLIASKELEAFDVSDRGSRRPTWNVSPASVAAFMRKRSNRAAA